MGSNRLERVRHLLEERQLERMLITTPEHVRYLSGFSGSSGWLLIGKDEQILLTDFRYKEQSARQSPDWTLHMVTQGLVAGVRELAAERNGAAIGFESGHLTVREYEHLTATGDDTDTTAPMNLVSTEELLRDVIIVKDEGEISTIAEAAAVTDAVFAEILELIRPGVTEIALAAEVEYRMRLHGAEKAAFPTIVASGPNAALPHATPTDREIQKGDMVTFDLGAQVNGYASDMTRTVSVGEPTEKLREIYGIVLEAQQAGVEAVRPGITGVDLDAVARDIISEYGYGDAFGHSLGHGVGMQVHEGPFVSFRSRDTIAENMIITIEPGIYLPGWGGVRIEDLVAVGPDGARVLSSTTKELLSR